MKKALDKEEQDLLASFEAGEWRPVKNQKQEMAKHKRIAENTLRKDRRVNIRLSARDLEEIQILAHEFGIPYQTLMASILHRYISGSLMDRPRSRKSAG